MAARGVVRPGQTVGGVILDARVVAFEPPAQIELELQTLNADEEFILAIVNEIGFRLKTHATATQVSY